MAMCLSFLTNGVYAANSDYISVNPEGVKPTSTGAGSVAVGINTNATGRDSFAAGISANATARNSTAVGVGANAKGKRATAIGNGGVAQAENAIGIGDNASGQSSISMGYQSTSTGGNNIAIGQSSTANGTESMAIGSNTRTYDAENNTKDKTALDTLRANYTIAGQNITYVGTSNTGSGQVAVGTNSHAGGWGASALGFQAHALNSQTSALGDDAKALGYASSAVGTHSYAFGRESTALGNGSEALGNQAAAIGSGSAATADKSIAMGWGAGASGIRSIAIGTSTGRVYPWQTDGNATSTTATELDQWAASGDYSIAMGTDTSADAKDSIALGHNAISTSIGGVAIGSKSLANRSALTGVTASSTASAAANQVYAMETANATDKATIISTVQGTQGAVSVGTDSQTRQIINVAAGSNDSDAVNVSQLKAVANTIKDVEVTADKLGSRINKVGAGAAALAALHPLDFDPDDKWNISAGYGNYKNANAMALGAFYRPNEDTMFSVASSMGNGENTVNAGVTLKLGQKSGVTNSKVTMAKEILELRDNNKYLNDKVDTLQSQVNKLLGLLDINKTSEFPDVPENHWAYEYVSVLAGNGIIQGYPDGTFKGNTPMTRYEFATMVYRALQNGATSDTTMNRLEKEFEPELRQLRIEHFRVDRVSGKDSDRHKIERIRVNDKDNKNPDDYRDVYGSHIQIQPSK